MVPVMEITMSDLLDHYDGVLAPHKKIKSLVSVRIKSYFENIVTI